MGPDSEGVATLCQGTLFRGDIVPSTKIPIIHYSKWTLFLVRLYSKCDFIPRSHQSKWISFQGDMSVENIPRSHIYSEYLTRSGQNLNHTPPPLLVIPTGL